MDQSESSLQAENAALKKQNLELQEEVKKPKTEVAELKKRKAPPSSASGSFPPKKARTAGQVKKLFEKWSKALNRLSAKHSGSPYTAEIVLVGRPAVEI